MLGEVEVVGAHGVDRADEQRAAPDERHPHGGPVAREGPQRVAEREPAGGPPRVGLAPSGPSVTTAAMGTSTSRAPAPVRASSQPSPTSSSLPWTTGATGETDPQHGPGGGASRASSVDERSFPTGALGHLVVEVTSFLGREPPLEVREEPLPPHAPPSSTA